MSIRSSFPDGASLSDGKTFVAHAIRDPGIWGQIMWLMLHDPTQQALTQGWLGCMCNELNSLILA